MNNKQFSILQNYMILQFLLFLIGIFCTLQLAALPVEIPFSLPSLQKVDIRKVNNVEKQHEDNFDNEVQSFTNYKLLRIKPNNERDVEYLQDLYNSHDSPYELNFWQPPTKVGSLVDITVSPEDAKAFTEELNGRELEYYIISDDLQRLIEKERPSYYNYHSQSSQDPDDSLNYHYDRYNPLSTIEQHLFQLRDENPRLLTIIDIGKTHQNRSIYTVKVSSPEKSEYTLENSTTAVWVDAGIHAREWIAPATAMLILKKLVDGYNLVDAEIRRYIKQIDWYLTIVLNPDGYEYSHTKNRMWRKNRRPTKCKINRFGNQVCCVGVDLNRNFEWHFSNLGSSDDPCHETYHGPEAFSEPESTAVRNFLHKTHVNAFITLHSYSQLWLIPYGHKKQTYPKSFSTVLKPLSIKATNAISRLFGTKYGVGTSADLLYEASGTSHDYAQGKLKIPYSFLVELRPQNVMFNSGFLLPESEIIATGDEIWEAMKVIAEELIVKFNENKITTKIVPFATTKKISITIPTTTQTSTENSSNKDYKNSTSSTSKYHKKSREKINLITKKNEINTKYLPNKLSIVTNMTNELISASSERSGMEIVLMIELKRGNKKKVVGFVKERPKIKSSSSSENLATKDSKSEEFEISTKSPRISKLILLPKTTTTFVPKQKSNKKLLVSTSAPTTIHKIKTTFSPPNEVIIDNKQTFLTTLSTLSTIVTPKNIYCYDFSYYCKWWKIHNLCKKPEVKAKCSLSCLPECQI